MRILLMTAGGTIGSTVKDGSIDVDSSSAMRLVHSISDKDIRIEISSPTNILSENVLKSDLNKIISKLSKVNCDKYSGIVLTYGTDTLCYFASLISMLFGHLPIPVVITAADYPLEDKRSNGYENFRAAIDILKSVKRGVYCVFTRSGIPEVYLPTRMREADAYYGAFSYFGKPFGVVNDGRLMIYGDIGEERINSCMPVLSKRVEIKNDILLLSPKPLFDFSQVRLKKCTAVLIYLYHSGSGCTVGGKYSLSEFLMRTLKTTPCYMASVHPSAAQYASTIKLIGAHCGILSDISMEAAWAKLLIAYNQREMLPEQYLEKNIYFEHIGR